MDAENTKERELALTAQADYGAGDYSNVMNTLDSFADQTPAILLNRLLTRHAMESISAESYLSELDRAKSTLHSDLDLDQLVLIDYNRALLTSKYLGNHEKAITILERRVEQSSLTSQAFGGADEKLATNAIMLLAILLMEWRKQPARSLTLLQSFPARKEGDQSHTAIRIQTLKAKALILLGQVRAAKKEMKAISGDPMVRSYLELLRGNLKKSIKIFQSPTLEAAEPFKTNNEAVIQWAQGRRTWAAHAIAKLIHDPATPQAHKLDLLYNYGVMSLHTGNPRVAEPILGMLTQKMFTRNPRLWLRLAEMKISAFLKVMGAPEICSFEEYASKRRSNFILGHTAEGPHRKLKFKSPQRLSADAEVLLQEARVYAQNSLLVHQRPLPSGYEHHRHSTSASQHAAFTRPPPATIEPPPSSVPPASSVPDQSSASNIGVVPADYAPASAPSDEDLPRLRVAALNMIAYTSLVLEDYSLARHAARQAVAIPVQGGYLAHLSRMYLGEALLSSGDFREAVKCFDLRTVLMGNVQDTSESTISDRTATTTSNGCGTEEAFACMSTSGILTAGTGGTENSEPVPSRPLWPHGWYSMGDFRLAFSLNAAIGHVLAGNLESAQERLREITAVDQQNFPLHAIMLNVYLEISNGNLDTARQIIKLHFPQFR